MNIKFYKSSSTPTDVEGGSVWMDPNSRVIQVYTGSIWQKMTGDVIDASYEESTSTLQIVKSDGSVVSMIFATKSDLQSLESRLNLLDQTKVSLPNPLGSGDKFLSDDGTYKSIEYCTNDDIDNLFN